LSYSQRYRNGTGPISFQYIGSLSLFFLFLYLMMIPQGEDSGDFSKSYDIQNPVLQELDTLKEEVFDLVAFFLLAFIVSLSHSWQ
jgi:hypothetical protein